MLSEDDFWNLYDVDCVDDQHSHGKSIGKYHIVNRIKVLLQSIDLPLDHEDKTCKYSMALKSVWSRLCWWSTLTW